LQASAHLLYKVTTGGDEGYIYGERIRLNGLAGDRGGLDYKTDLMRQGRGGVQGWKKKMVTISMGWRMWCIGAPTQKTTTNQNVVSDGKSPSRNRCNRNLAFLLKAQERNYDGENDNP